MTELIKPSNKIQNIKIKYGKEHEIFNLETYDFSKAELFPSMRYIRQDYR